MAGTTELLAKRVAQILDESGHTVQTAPESLYWNAVNQAGNEAKQFQSNFNQNVQSKVGGDLTQQQQLLQRDAIALGRNQDANRIANARMQQAKDLAALKAEDASRITAGESEGMAPGRPSPESPTPENAPSAWNTSDVTPEIAAQRERMLNAAQSQSGNYDRMAKVDQILKDRLNPPRPSADMFPAPETGGAAPSLGQLGIGGLNTAEEAARTGTKVPLFTQDAWRNAIVPGAAFVGGSAAVQGANKAIQDYRNQTPSDAGPSYLTSDDLAKIASKSRPQLPTFAQTAGGPITPDMTGSNMQPVTGFNTPGPNMMSISPTQFQGTGFSTDRVATPVRHIAANNDASAAMKALENQPSGAPQLVSRPTDSGPGFFSKLFNQPSGPTDSKSLWDAYNKSGSASDFDRASDAMKAEKALSGSSDQDQNFKRGGTVKDKKEDPIHHALSLISHLVGHRK